MEYAPPKGLVGFGVSTGLVRVLPEVRSHAAAPAPVRVEAGVVPMGARNHVVVSHAEGERWEDETGRWVRVMADTRGVRLGVGKGWHDDATLPGGTTSLDLHPLHGTSGYDEMQRDIEQMLALYGPFLPPFPHERLAIVEGTRHPLGAWVSWAPASSPTASSRR